jgi:ADP-heptose:LPS heptosyltransferase
MRLLIVRLDHLGDLLLTTPLIRAAAKAGHEVHLLVREGGATVFASNPEVTTHAVESVAPDFPRRWWRLGAWMRRQRFEMILLPYAKPRQLLLATAISGARRRIAMWGGLLGRLTLHQCLRSGIASGSRHLSQILLDCAAAAGFPADGLNLDFPLGADEIAAARADFDARFPGLAVVGIHPGCAGNTCNPGPEVYGRLAALLLEHPGLAVVATGIPAERPLFNAWPAGVLDHPRFYNACGQWNLRQLAAHVANFATLVVVGTGPLHIASALGIPTVSPFCRYPPISAAVWGNLTPGSIALSPPAEFCARRRAAAGAGHCDFEGQISAADLCAAVMRIVAMRGPANLELRS